MLTMAALCKAAGIKIEGDNKWKTIIQAAAKAKTAA